MRTPHGQQEIAASCASICMEREPHQMGGTESIPTLLMDLVFTRGSASACVFRHVEKTLVASVHGHDFTIAGPKKHLDQPKAAGGASRARTGKEG